MEHNRVLDLFKNNLCVQCNIGLTACGKEYHKKCVESEVFRYFSMIVVDQEQRLIKYVKTRMSEEVFKELMEMYADRPKIHACNKLVKSL